MYTLKQLAAHDGSDPALPILLAVGGNVFDVTEGKRFYGPGGPYSCLAGKACTRALAKWSLDPADINDDGVSDEERLEAVRMYAEKYPVVGHLADTTRSRPI